MSDSPGGAAHHILAGVLAVMVGALLAVAVARILPWLHNPEPSPTVIVPEPFPSLTPSCTSEVIDGELAVSCVG